MKRVYFVPEGLLLFGKLMLPYLGKDDYVVITDCNQSRVDHGNILYSGTNVKCVHVPFLTKGKVEAHMDVLGDYDKIIVAPVGENIARDFLNKYLGKDSRVGSMHTKKDYFDLCANKSLFMDTFPELTPKRLYEGRRFIKPTRGSGGTFSFITNGPLDMNMFEDGNGYPIGDVVEQELMVYPEYNIELLFNPNDKTYKTFGRLCIDSHFSTDTCVEILNKYPDGMQEVLDAFVKKASSICDISGLSNIQMMRNKKGEFKIIEVNARFTSGIEVFELAGIPIIGNLIRFMEGGTGVVGCLPLEPFVMVRHFVPAVIRGKSYCEEVSFLAEAMVNI